MAKVTGFLNFNLEHTGEEVSTALGLIKKLPHAVEEFNSGISIKSNVRISKAQLGILEEWVEKSSQFEQYLKSIT